MKVFISWSGNLSKQIAELLKTWIEDVLQGTEPWLSCNDIDKGSFWFSAISENLSEISVGILCLTAENINAPWLLFETGALSKGLSKNRVCPLLINLSPSDLSAPLSQFNATSLNKEDMLKLIKTINDQNGDMKLAENRVEKAFDRWWNDFDTKYKKIIKDYKPEKVHKKTPEEMIKEILETTRAIQRNMQVYSTSKDMELFLRQAFDAPPNSNFLVFKSSASREKKQKEERKKDKDINIMEDNEKNQV